jgi:hypothetical protein
MQMWSGSTFWASASRFLGNAARGGQVGNLGGALSSFGGRITLDDGTLFTDNRAEGGSVVAAGGAITTKISGELFLDQAEFTRNEARGGSQTMYVRGGALEIIRGKSSIRSSRFVSNVVRTGSAQTLGGAICQQDGSVVDIVDSSFARNEALDGPFVGGGAIRVGVGATITVATSMFESNVADAAGGEAYGGALSVDGNLIVNEGNAFLNNSVSSKSKAAGGAIAVMQLGQCRFAAHSQATFAQNLVRIPAGGFSLFLTADRFDHRSISACSYLLRRLKVPIQAAAHCIPRHLGHGC